MLEIVHDLAPARSCSSRPPSTASYELRPEHSRPQSGRFDIIIDDVFYFVETPFQDGRRRRSFPRGTRASSSRR